MKIQKIIFIKELTKEQHPKHPGYRYNIRKESQPTNPSKQPPTKTIEGKESHNHPTELTKEHSN